MEQVHTQQIQKVLPPNVMLVQYKFPDGTITSSEVIYKKLLKRSGSPVLFLKDLLYCHKNLPEGAFYHFLSTQEKCQVLFNMILYSLYLFRYVDKLPWNWISDFGAPLVPLQHADTNSNPIFIGICKILYSHYLQIFNPQTLFAAKKDPTGFPLS